MGYKWLQMNLIESQINNIATFNLTLESNILATSCKMKDKKDLNIIF